MSTQFEFIYPCPESLLTQNGVTVSHLLIYGKIVTLKKGGLYKTSALVEWTGLSRRTVFRCIKQLIEWNFLEKRQGKIIIKTSIENDLEEEGEPEILTPNSATDGTNDPQRVPRMALTVPRVALNSAIRGTPHYLLDKYKDNKQDNNIYIPPAEDSDPFIELSDYPKIKLRMSDAQKLGEHYEELRLGKAGIEEALSILSGYAEDNPKKFSKYKNHYLVLRGWVKQEVIKRKRNSLGLFRETAYAELASKRLSGEGEMQGAIKAFGKGGKNV